ncbi:GNAT family N-acetyltransferase [Salipaludibacillus daqingensis]|uniref:GNAT family N-acetyltransferase n=1 Tax=Salipaludibacillus daqingensis TaxID=3041001 RepID=UPI00247518E6|nr:GNAT family N-acetyltransferase [Salipaludibacillus daqingensis]
MDKSIRKLHSKDYIYFEAMDTGLEEDYVGRIFEKLTSGNHALYGMFIDSRMVSMGGYSIFAGRYAMLGRLRSDRRFRGNNFATELISHIMNEASQVNGIHWVGANTQEYNTAARRVLEKQKLNCYVKLYGAITNDVSNLETGGKLWNPILSLDQKKEWIKEVYLKSPSVFPYECYYTFPTTDDLFQEEDIQKWSFFESEDKSRVLITKYDQKKDHYLHAVYPWSDISTQRGLWETITNEYNKLVKNTDGETYIWMDLTKEEVITLPNDHKFEVDSPWILYGMDIKNEA